MHEIPYSIYVPEYSDVHKLYRSTYYVKMGMVCMLHSEQTAVVIVPITGSTFAEAKK